MDILNQIIQLLTKEELRHFKLYATRAHDRDDRKDLVLFDQIRKKGDAFDERKILKELYPDGRKNTYHRLRHRLLTEINKSLVTLHWDSNSTLEAVHYLSLSILFRERQEFEVAYYYLRKCESKARELENLALTDLVLGEYITLSYNLPEINPEKYIQMRNENLRTLNRLREMDNVLAAVNYRIRSSQNVAQKDASILEILQKTVDEFASDPMVRDHPQFRFRMYNAVSRILLQQRDYPSLESYLLTTYDQFEKEGLFDRSNHDTRLQMLCYVINTLFKNQKIEQSLEYNAKLYEAMHAFGKMHFEKYLYFYYSSLATNYSVTNPSKAMETLETLLADQRLTRNPAYEFYTRIQLAQMQFLLAKHDKGAKNLAKIKLLESYSNADEALQLRIELLELANRYEQGEMEVVEYRSQQIGKDFSDLLAQPSSAKEAALLRILNKAAFFPRRRLSPELKADSQAFIDQFASDDTELFKYSEWLRSLI